MAPAGEEAENVPVIIPILRNVPHPWQRLIPALLYNLEVPHLDPGYSEVWDFVFDGDRRAFFDIGF